MPWFPNAWTSVVLKVLATESVGWIMISVLSIAHVMKNVPMVVRNLMLAIHVRHGSVRATYCPLYVHRKAILTEILVLTIANIAVSTRDVAGQNLTILMGEFHGAITQNSI